MKEQKIDLKEMNKDNNQGEIVIYQTDDGDTKIDVRFVDETVWLTQAQLCELYQTSKSNVSEHIKNIFEEGELEENSVVRKFRTTESDGRRICELIMQGKTEREIAAERIARKHQIKAYL